MSPQILLDQKLNSAYDRELIEEGIGEEKTVEVYKKLSGQN